jgi:hypothetical protein
VELLVVIVNKEEYFEKILSVLVELDVTGATILESEGLGHFLAYEVPIFAGLRQLVGESKSPSKTVLALVEEKDILKKLNEFLIDEEIDFTDPQVGVIFTVPVNGVVKPER